MIKQLEQQHKQTPSTSLLTPLKEAPRELNNLISDKIEGNLRFVKQKLYEHGNRASRLLAFRLRKQQSSNIVQKRKSKNSTTFLTKPDEIAESLADFYKALYQNSDT